MDEQRKRLQKELPDIEKLSLIPQKINSKWSLKQGCSSSCRTLSKKRHDLLREHQRVQKTSQHSKEETARGRDPWTCEENSRMGTPVHVEGNSEEEEPSTSSGRSHTEEWWRARKKRKEKKWKKIKKKKDKKKKVKYSRKELVEKV